MMSRNSCSKGLVRDCMKRNLWAIVLSTVGFFMAQLLPVIMTAQHSLSAHKQDLVNLSAADAAASWQGYVESVGEMLGGQNVFVKLAVIILAVTCGVSTPLMVVPSMVAVSVSTAHSASVSSASTFGQLLQVSSSSGVSSILLFSLLISYSRK